MKNSDKIKTLRFEAGNYVNIADDVEILCPDLKLGNNVYIGSGSKISCRSLEIGDDTFMQGDVLVEGCRDNLETKVKIGCGNLICTGTRINCNFPVNIGDDVGIGQHVRIWTHGYYMDRLEGYPYNTGKVNIGNHVWLMEGSIVLPGVSIGDNTLIAINSFVHKDLPSGCFAAGNPVEVIKENKYPPKISYEDKVKIVEQVVSEYNPIMRSKGFMKDIETDGLKIYFDANGRNPVMFDCETRQIEGSLDKYGEDFRDHLRRGSIKFFNGTPFRSIVPLDFKELMEK